MEPTSRRGTERPLETARAIYRRDDEEYETPPRWLASRLRDGLPPYATTAARPAARAVTNPDGGQ